ncbi:MAG TPA: hypothetical protein VFL82_12340 [Thermomicrobiales bacterium]|nr:hypothetical protein [Thermomicrobiales bacterium]
MHIPLDLAIREQLNEYLIGNLTLDDFKDWLVGVSWDFPDGQQPTAARLAIRIKHRLAEQSSGYCSEEEMKELLRPLAAKSASTVNIGEPA